MIPTTPTLTLHATATYNENNRWIIDCMVPDKPSWDGNEMKPGRHWRIACTMSTRVCWIRTFSFCVLFSLRTELHSPRALHPSVRSHPNNSANTAGSSWIPTPTRFQHFILPYRIFQTIDVTLVSKVFTSSP
jgi:hypothetical protein